MPLMTAALASSLIDLLLASTLGGPQAGNRVSLEGLSWSATKDGALEIGVRRMEAASLRIASGPLSGVKLRAPLDAAAAGPWTLGPLAGADGTLRAEIVDAHLLFDADVTVPMRGGRIDFADATVEHVGPDSRMGISRLGIHVDAPNGRSYLYQFSTPPIAGVDYQHRGSLQLQPFAEWLLRQPLGGRAHGVTEQARLLFDRTAVSGEIQLSDGPVATPFAQADLVGRAGGRNVIRLHSQAVGRGLTVEVSSLSVRNVASASGGRTRLACEQVTGALTLQLSVDGGQLKFSMDLAGIQASGVRLQVQLQEADGRFRSSPTTST